MVALCRGVEQMVARRAHNPEVVRFKSHPRNQKERHSLRVSFVFVGGGIERERRPPWAEKVACGKFLASRARACDSRASPTPATTRMGL